jgi:hypothetical protein
VLAFAGLLAALVSFRLGGFRPDHAWTEWVMKGAAVGMVLAAALLWFARGKAGPILGALLLLACVAGSAITYGSRLDIDFGSDSSKMTFQQGRTAPLTRAEIAAVPQGATRAHVIKLLGRPTERGMQRVLDGPDLPCVAYLLDPDDSASPNHLHGFCFSHGTLATQRDW